MILCIFGKDLFASALLFRRVCFYLPACPMGEMIVALECVWVRVFGRSLDMRNLVWCLLSLGLWLGAGLWSFVCFVWNLGFLLIFFLRRVEQSMYTFFDFTLNDVHGQFFQAVFHTPCVCHVPKWTWHPSSTARLVVPCVQYSDFLFHSVFGFKLFKFAQLFVSATSTIAPPRTEQTLAKIMVWGRKYKS